MFCLCLVYSHLLILTLPSQILITTVIIFISTPDSTYNIIAHYHHIQPLCKLKIIIASLASDYEIL